MGLMMSKRRQKLKELKEKANKKRLAKAVEDGNYHAMKQKDKKDEKKKKKMRRGK